MQAARVHSWGAEPVVEELPDPVPGDGESLVLVAAAAVAHIDLTVSSGTFAVQPTLPHVPGTEGAGRVLRSGMLSPGTPVHVRGGGVGLRRPGTWASLTVVPDEALTALPDGIDPTLAATYFSPCASAHVALHEVGRLAAGERVAVAGVAGAVGGVAAQLARRAGAAEVVGFERDAARAAAAPAAVAVRHGPDALERLEPVDLLIDTVGGQDLAQRVMRGVRPGGRAVLVGYVAGEQVTFDLPNLLAADVRLLPMNLIRWERHLRPQAGELLRAVSAGEIELRRTVVPLAELPRALERLRAGTVAGRLAVLMTDEEGSRG